MYLKLTPKYQYAGVYMIKNTRTGKVYIGSSWDIEQRLKEHRRCLARGKHPCKALQSDYNDLHPMTTHVLYVEAVPIGSPRMKARDKIYAMEWKFIKEYNAIENGYNRMQISHIRSSAI